MMNYLPPAGTLVKLNDIVRWLFSARHKKSLNQFSEAITQKFSVKHCHFFNTGRAAMSRIAKNGTCIVVASSAIWRDMKLPWKDAP